MVRRDLVLNETLGPGVLQVLGKNACGVLVDPAEGVVPPIRPLHGEALGLPSADAKKRLETTRERVKI